VSENFRPTYSELKKVRARDWILLNLNIGALSFGGSGRIYLYQEAVVDRNHWMSDEEFQEIFTMIQVLPGPNLVNLSVYLGYRLAGRIATFLGVLALATPGAALAIFILEILDLKNFHISSLFQGFSLGSIALFGAFLWRLKNGLLPSQKKAERKFAFRLVIIAAITGSVFMSVPLFWILILGIPLSVAAEFFT
jgi:chromate transporter